MFQLKNVHQSWHDFFKEDILEILNDIEGKIGIDFTPSSDKILKFAKTDLSKIKVCIVGQDVYFQRGVATGRAFEVNGLNSWFQKFNNSSLKNLLRLIYISYNNIEDYKDIKTFKEILTEISSGGFSILPPHELFESLEMQGVLFLNTSLTTKIGKANAHKKYWTEFSHKLFQYITFKRKDLIWFLWGDNAISTKEWIKSGLIYTCHHPMICSEKYNNDFLKSRCVKDTMCMINWKGI